MMHPDTRLAQVNDRVGFGVFATRRIPAGTITWVRDPLDQRISRELARRLDPLFRVPLKHFTFWEEDRESLILCWDHGRYINHSCDATCLGGGFEFEIAVRDIEVGEELTDDYGTFGYFNEFSCGCGAASCRGQVRAQDQARLGAFWDARLLTAMRDLPAVEQPLWSLVMDKERVQRSLSDPRSIPLHRVA
jgi:hypothetical protein